MKPLSSYFRVRRRYSRSVNLERDLAVADSLQGYIPTPRGLEVLDRIAAAMDNPQAAARAWTITGVYGTGKSAFAHLLAALCGPADDPARLQAEQILRGSGGSGALADALSRIVPESGLVRAVVTGRREPLSHTVLRGLLRGVDAFWTGKAGRKPAVRATLAELWAGVERGADPDLGQLPELIREAARVSGSGLLVVIDELGKVLEHAAASSDRVDLYLLQQLAELPVRPGEPPVLVVGLLHQSFAEYGHGLTTAERAEWDKVQGRFESVLFAEAPEQMLRLVSNVIEPDLPSILQRGVSEAACAWESLLRDSLKHPYVAEMLPAKLIESLYPLHPVTAVVLPTLCAKYAQNDRSLFTFLTSEEPHSLPRFLAEHHATGEPDEQLPVLRLPELYDYFIDVAGVGVSVRGQFQRWAEVHGLIQDAVGLSDEEAAALKVIGTLNLVTSVGPLRASRGMVLAALVENPGDRVAAERWEKVLEELVTRRLVTYRRQIDELRIWEGSDYDVEAAVQLRLDADRRPLATILSKFAPVLPVVAERHSYQTGTLRYFERRYIESEEALEGLCASPTTDGVIAYWAAEQLPPEIPATTADGRPLVVVAARELGALRSAARELAALSEIERTEAALQTDGVARREVRQRLIAAQTVLENVLRSAFDPRAGRGHGAVRASRCWVGGTPWIGGSFNGALSALCDQSYPNGPVLWNELLNRRELTSQGARARREVIEALIEHHPCERLGLTGFGPEVSMYTSALLNTGIHHAEAGGQWVLGPPTEQGLLGVWQAIEAFFENATEEARSLEQLYSILDAPPIGAKAGLIPLIIAAALLHHADDVSLYRDGSFLPVLGAEQFEILVKQPGRFAVKHLRLQGIRFELFRELERVIIGAGAPLPANLRNTTLLGVVRPLLRFAKSLPEATRRTRALSAGATAVRDTLLSAREPDRLVFEALPVACGLAPFAADEPESTSARHVVAFRRALLRALTELQNHYQVLLGECRARLTDAFAVSSDGADLREHLRVRAHYLVGRVLEPRLKSFVGAAADPEGNDQRWIESIAMVVAQRPADTWSEEDALAFEANLSDLARRFTSLESLQREAGAEGRDGFDARRVAITRPDGSEIHRLVWLNEAERELVDAHVRRLLDSLQGIQFDHQRQAVAVAMIERLLQGRTGAEDEGPESADNREASNG